MKTNTVRVTSVARQRTAEVVTVTVEGFQGEEAWTATGGDWDRSKKKGRSGGGLVIKSVDRGKWIAVRKILIPLKTSTATAVEARVAYILTEVLDLFIGQQVNVHSVPPEFLKD